MTNGLSKMTKTGLDKLKCFGQNYWPCQCLQCPKWPCYLVKALINGHMHKCLLINWKLAKRSQRRVFMTSYKSMSSSSWLPCILKGSFRHFLGTFGGVDSEDSLAPPSLDTSWGWTIWGCCCSLVLVPLEKWRNKEQDLLLIRKFIVCGIFGRKSWALDSEHRMAG